MSDYEYILNNLNDECKSIIQTTFNKASIDNQFGNSKSFVLAFLNTFYKHNKDIWDVLSKYESNNSSKQADIITLLNEFNENSYIGKELKFNETKCYQNYRYIWKQHIDNLILYIKVKKKQYNFNYSIDISEIEPFIIFDYFYQYYKFNLVESIATFKNKLEKHLLNDPIIEQTFSIYDSIFNKDKIARENLNYELSKELFELMDKKYKEYFELLKETKSNEEEKMDMDDDLKLDFNNVIFSYENGKYYLIFKNNEERNVNVFKEENGDIKEKGNIQLPIKSEIILINCIKPSFQEILNSVRDMYYNFNLITLALKFPNSDEMKTYTLETSSLLGEKPTKIFSGNIKENSNIDDEVINKTPNLDKYGKNLTKEDYLKDPSIGRDSEMRRLYQILLYPEKDKSIIITGDAGVGKTALIKGLAYRIQKGDVPKQLNDLKIYSISVSTLVAGTKYVGTLEEKLQGILNEARKDKNIILFIDEIHQAIGAGTSEKDNNSVAEILKPYIDYGDVRVIGATTNNEYEEYVASDEAFKTRFKKVDIFEPNEGTIYIILEDLINKYNKISESKIKEENIDMIIKWLISATDKKYRKYNDKASNPRLILDIIKEAYAISALNESNEVTTEHLIEAYRSEDRLYNSSKESQIQTLRSLIPHKSECQIIKFIPKK